jgi:hypothetical protein
MDFGAGVLSRAGWGASECRRNPSLAPSRRPGTGEASAWSGHCDGIPAAAGAPTLDGLLDKIAAMALDLLPDNHPAVDPQSLLLQITAFGPGAGEIPGA